MSPKNRSVVFPARFQLPLLVAGAALTLFACADKGGTDDAMDGLTGNPTASGTATGTPSATTSAPASTTSAPVTTMMPTMTVPTMTMGTTTATATASMTATSSTQAPSASVTATASETVAPDDSATGGGGGMGASPTSSASGEMGSAGAGGMDAMNTGGGSGAGTGGAGGMSGGDPDADVEITAEDFTCIADWPKVLGFRITNIMGHEDEAVAVAEAGTGKYPVGTIIQHLPTEAMVKHKDGYSPETKDWEFFQLAINSGTTMITNQGTTDVMTMGNTCASCHDDAPDEYDFVLNTYQADGNMLAFDFGDAMLDMQIASDPRCP